MSDCSGNGTEKELESSTTIMTPPPESPHLRDRKHIVLKYPTDSPKTMLHALEYIYTGKTSVRESQLLDLASLADRFLMPELTRHCLEMYEGKYMGYVCIAMNSIIEKIIHAGFHLNPSTAFLFFSKCFECNQDTGLDSPLLYP